MAGVPSPADLAGWFAGRRAATSPSAAETLLRRSFPDVVTTAEAIGCNFGSALEDWTAQAGGDSVATWINRDVSDRTLAAEWISTQAVPNALAALVQEAQVSARGGSIGSYIKSAGGSLSGAIEIARRRAALALVQHSISIPFYRPVVLSRALELTVEYLKAVLPPDTDFETASSETKRLNRELGKAVVTLARFSLVPDEEMRMAMRRLQNATSEQGATEVTRAHYLEACLHLYHQSGDREPLKSAVEMIAQSTVADNDWGAWHLNSAEVWLALADTAETPAGRTKFLARAREALDLSLQLDLELTYEIKRCMLDAFLRFREEDKGRDIQFRGIQFPFGLRTRIEPMPDAFVHAASYLIAALKPAANRGQYAYRDTLSELFSYLARNAEDNQDRIRWMLSEALRLRDPVGRKAALAGMRSAVAQAEDCFLLAHLSRKPGSLRTRGASLLLDEISKDPTASDPLILLAREVEVRGPIQDVPGKTEIVGAIRTGAHKELYAIAAERALESPDLLRKGLGGRGGIVTVEDYSGVTGQTFVFKKMTRAGHSRDNDLAQSIRSHLHDYDLEGRFGVIEHLTSVQLPLTEEVVSVRRFTDGLPLRRAIELEPVSGHRALLNTIDYLAFFHATEEQSPDHNWRREVQAKEVGRWLRHIMPASERTLAVEKLSDLVSDMPLVRRRDAHTLNWLLGDRAKIFAVDLDATGWRPLGYELAQLTDDYPIFDPDNLRRRRELVRFYGERLRAYGLQFDDARLYSSYFSALAARSARSLGDPAAGDAGRMHSFRLLQKIASSADLPEIKEWAGHIRDAWARKAGLVDGAEMVVVSDRQRRRISRGMAFHLRHDATAPTTRDGWIYAEDLAELMQRNGHRVSAEQLLIVAGAMGEPRFQLEGTEIRATYGHTRQTSIEYMVRVPPKYLFHVTPRANFSSIFEARAGLLPMARQMVHLTEDSDVALASDRRGRAHTLVLRVEAQRVQGLVHAASSTWLAPRVETDHLNVMTVRDVAEIRSRADSM